MRDAKTFTGGVDEIASQFFRRRVRDRVNHGMQLAIALFETREQALDIFIFRNIAHKPFCSRKRQNQVSRFLLQALVLIGNGQLHAGRVQSLRNGPRDRTLVRDSEHNGSTALEIRGHVGSLGMEKNSRHRRFGNCVI